MMKQQHPIDDLFQRGLKNHSVPPPMHVWEGVDEHRAIRQRGELALMRRKVLAWSSLAAVLLLGLWLGWQDNPELGSFPIVTSTAIASAQEADAATESLTGEQMEVQEAAVIPKVERTPTRTVSLPVKEVIEEQEGIASAMSLEALASPSGIDPTPELEEELTSKNITSFTSLNTLESLPATIPVKAQALDMHPLQMPDTDCARFSNGKPAIFLALTAGPSFSSRTFSARDEEYLGYANQRSNTESPQLSYGASARLSVVFPWGGAIRSGVGYTQINEKMVYKNSRVRQTTITEIYGPNGEVIGTDTTYITDNTILKFNNRHRLIDIPIQLGYEVRYNNFTLAANAGVNVNIAYSQEGSYLGDQDLLPTRFDSDDPNATPIYKSKVGLGWQASLGLHYQLNDRLDLMAEPYLRYYPESFTRNDYPLSQKYLIGGVGLGLRVLL